MKIFLGNLPFTAKESRLHELFSAHGEVDSISLVTDRNTGRQRGFGFIDMVNGGERAIEALNGAEFDGRNLNVNEAR